jgi:hypothetical protein
MLIPRLRDGSRQRVRIPASGRRAVWWVHLQLALLALTRFSVREHCLLVESKRTASGRADMAVAYYLPACANTKTASESYISNVR